jgi:23S rRNA pseudouridine2605 synthase
LNNPRRQNKKLRGFRDNAGETSNNHRDNNMPRYSYMGRPLKARPEELEDHSEKLHKALAAAGMGSRREMEQLIADGRVSLNGQIAKVADRVKPGDLVKVNGKVIRLGWKKQIPRVLIYHKQEGEIVSRDDPEGRRSVFDNLPPVRSGRWISIGRLDFNTEGLLIFTTDGELANHLTHPRYEVEREYAVRLIGALDAVQMNSLLNGVELDDGIAKVDKIVPAGGEGVNQWYHLIIKEGRNREVRRLMEHLGLTVSRLIRVRFGPVAMPSRLKRGMKEELPEEEVEALLRWCGMVKTATDQRRSDERGESERSEPKRPEAAPGKVGHPYRRRLNNKGERQ